MKHWMAIIVIILINLGWSLHIGVIGPILMCIIIGIFGLAAYGQRRNK